VDSNFNRSADFTLMDVLGPYTDAQGMNWSDGVSQGQYDDWCKKNNSPSHDVRSISWTPTKKQIMGELYWLPNCRLMPPGMDYLFFDAAQNISVVDAIIILQMTVAAPLTGIIDDATKAQLAKLVLPLTADFVHDFCDAHELHFTDVVATHPDNEAKLRHHWLNRTAHERVNAVAILKGG
jgi:lysozyme family protein